MSNIGGQDFKQKEQAVLTCVGVFVTLFSLTILVKYRRGIGCNVFFFSVVFVGFFCLLAV